MDIYTIKELLLQAQPKSIIHLNRYIKLIGYAIEHSTKEKKYDRHHILPRSMFPEYASFKEHPWNKIKLSKRQHFIAHKMLWKAFRNKETTCAFWLMYISSDGKKLSSKEYAILREEVSNKISSHRKEKWKDPVFYAMMMGTKRVWTKEEREQTSKATKDYFSNDENRKLHSEKEKAKWDDEYRAFRKNLTTQQWKDDDYRTKQLAVRRKSIFTIEKSCGNIITTDSLKKWCKVNSYNDAQSYKLLNGKLSFYKDIIKITKSPK